MVPGEAIPAACITTLQMWAKRSKFCGESDGEVVRAELAPVTEVRKRPRVVESSDDDSPMVSAPKRVDRIRIVDDDDDVPPNTAPPPIASQ